MFPFKNDCVVCVLLLALSVFVYSRGLQIHGIEYRDDEIFYFKSTQEMVQTRDYLSPKYFGEDRFQKPILYYWMVLLSYKIFGVNWVGARFVAVLFAGMSVCLTWLIAKRLFDRKIADLSVVILMTVPLFFRHAKNAVPDMPLNFFIVLAIYFGVRFLQGSIDSFAANDKKNLTPETDGILFFGVCAVGFMVKGFAALLFPFLTVIIFSLMARDIKVLARLRFGRGLAVMLLIICPWFLYMIKVHGQEYLNYMLIDETKNRLIADSDGNVFLRLAANFIDHVLFYMSVIGSYFAPWCIFLIGGIPLAFIKIKSGDKAKEGLRLMLIWFLAVFCFFSAMHFSINHYMLVLSTPFAILVSYFLIMGFDQRFFIGRAITVLRKYTSVMIFTACVLAFCFLFVFMAGASQWWLALFASLYLILTGKMIHSKDPVIAPMILGLFLMFVFAQSALLDKTGVTPHATLQKFARTINQEVEKRSVSDVIIGVGSHDIHEKEFQVYFDQRVEKAAGSMEEETRGKLNKLFSTDKELYCLITEKDFQKFLKDVYPGSVEIIQEDYIIRKRFNIDTGFFLALIKLNQEAVSHYMKEKLVLIRKKPNAG